MGNFKSKKIFDPVKLSPPRLESNGDLEEGKIFIDKNYSDIVMDKQSLLNEAKEFFHKGNDNFRSSNYEQAKFCYMEALEKLQMCDSTIRNHSFEEMTQCTEGIINYAVNRYFKAKYLIERTNRILPIRSNSLASASENLRKEIAAKRINEKEKKLAIELKEQGMLDSMFADLMNNLAACYELSGDLDNAKKLYEDSMSLRKVSYGPNSLKAAESMQNLATIYDSLGRLTMAEQLLTQALDIEKTILGEDNIQVTVSMNNLGLLKAHMGDIKKAIEYLEKTVEIRKKHFGEEHHLTKCAILNLDFTKNKDKLKLGEVQEEKVKEEMEKEKVKAEEKPIEPTSPLPAPAPELEEEVKEEIKDATEKLVIKSFPLKKNYLEGEFIGSRNSFSTPPSKTIGAHDWQRFSQDTDIDESLDSESHGTGDVKSYEKSYKPKSVGKLPLKSFKPFEKSIDDMHLKKEMKSSFYEKKEPISEETK